MLDRRTMLGAMAIGGAGIVGVGGFLYTGNAVGPRRLTARAIVDRFQSLNGVHPGFRRNHAKGVAVDGYFDSNGRGTQLSRASIFEAGRYRVCGRFSLSGGNPYIADDPGQVRGLGLRIDAAAGEQWRLAMINLPVFLDPTPKDFYDRMVAFAADPVTGKPDPDRVAAYLADHPRTKAAMALAKSVPTAPTFASTAFHGLNAFEATNAAGATVPIRWTLVPRTPATESARRGPHQLFDQLADDIGARPRTWSLVITEGVRGLDRTDDATVAWPKDRRAIEVGTLTLHRIMTETPDNVGTTNFDPLVLPDGIAASDDPLLPARSAAYAESFRRRAGEPRGRGAVQAGGAA